MSEAPVIEAGPRKGCPHCLSSPGRIRTLYKDRVPEGSNIKMGDGAKFKGTIRVMEVCRCVVNNARRIAVAQGIQGAITVKLKEAKNG